jgi:hypothetical protein
VCHQQDKKANKQTNKRSTMTASAIISQHYDQDVEVVLTSTAALEYESKQDDATNKSHQMNSTLTSIVSPTSVFLSPLQTSDLLGPSVPPLELPPAALSVQPPMQTKEPALSATTLVHHDSAPTQSVHKPESSWTKLEASHKSVQTRNPIRAIVDPILASLKDIPKDASQNEFISLAVSVMIGLYCLFCDCVLSYVRMTRVLMRCKSELFVDVSNAKTRTFICHIVILLVSLSVFPCHFYSSASTYSLVIPPPMGMSHHALQALEPCKICSLPPRNPLQATSLPLALMLRVKQLLTFTQRHSALISRLQCGQARACHRLQSMCRPHKTR